MIFNLWAVLAAIPIALVVWGLKSMFPALMDGPHLTMIVGIVAFVVGGICEFVGIKGRIFFVLPIWLAGLGIVGLEIGTVGIVVVVCIGAAMFFLAMRRTKQKEAEQWRKAQMIITNRESVLGASPKVFWEWIKEALFLPIWTDSTQEMCRHNLRVLETITLRPRELTTEESSPVYEVALHFKQNQDLPKPKNLNADLTTQMQEIIEAKIENRPSKLKGAGKSAPIPPKIPTPPRIPTGPRAQSILK